MVAAGARGILSVYGTPEGVCFRRSSVRGISRGRSFLWGGGDRPPFACARGVVKLLDRGGDEGVSLWSPKDRATRQRTHMDSPKPTQAAALRILVLGPPASGKGTHGRLLAEALGLAYLSTGAVLRENVENGTELGLKAKPILDRGGYLPDGLMCPILGDWLAGRNGGWVLDGFPRSLPQAVFLDEALGKAGVRVDRAISLEVPFDDLLERIRDRVECPDCRWTGPRKQLAAGGECPACGGPAAARPDDDEANFRSRHAEFERLTLPVIAHYRAAGLLSACDATPPRAEVAARLLGFIQGLPVVSA